MRGFGRSGAGLGCELLRAFSAGIFETLIDTIFKDKYVIFCKVLGALPLI